MNTPQALQQYLDSLSQIPGSILFRNRVSWEALPPGNAGEVLALSHDLLPEWQPSDPYSPAWMDLSSGAARYHRGNFTLNGANKVTIVGRVQITPRGSDSYLYLHEETSGTYSQPACLNLHPSGHASAPNKISFRCGPGSGGATCRLRSTVAIADGRPHSIFAEYDGDAGTARLLIDNQNADDTSWADRVLTTGTMHRGSGTYLGIGAGSTGNVPANGLYQHFGMAFVSGLDPNDFHTQAGAPKNIEADIITPWGGAQPLLWQESAKLDQNRGSLGNLTAVAPILLSNAPVL